MQHHRDVTSVVAATYSAPRPAGHLEVDLHRPALPGAADRVLEVVFDLRAVERAFAGKLRPFHAAFAQRIAQRVLGALPRRVVA
jgi:hypothetical protein